ncbi:hypothetical protein QYM36_019424 [Artemia franciscana]|uniref:Uncharacterized protein n=1 Tax=Artemia franciscana TaxID=6661 RepID=A0AA88KQZ0_ARTSF|nr:hypothetical protein QYM36_019424 [Artemia franciscana]
MRRVRGETCPELLEQNFLIDDTDHLPVACVPPHRHAAATPPGDPVRSVQGGAGAGWFDRVSPAPCGGVVRETVPARTDLRVRVVPEMTHPALHCRGCGAVPTNSPGCSDGVGAAEDAERGVNTELGWVQLVLPDHVAEGGEQGFGFIPEGGDGFDGFRFPPQPRGDRVCHRCDGAPVFPRVHGDLPGCVESPPVPERARCVIRGQVLGDVRAEPDQHPPQLVAFLHRSQVTGTHRHRQPSRIARARHAGPVERCRRRWDHAVAEVSENRRELPEVPYVRTKPRHEVTSRSAASSARRAAWHSRHDTASQSAVIRSTGFGSPQNPRPFRDDSAHTASPRGTGFGVNHARRDWAIGPSLTTAPPCTRALRTAAPRKRRSMLWKLPRRPQRPHEHKRPRLRSSPRSAR